MKNAKTLSFLHFLLFVLPLSAQEAEFLSPQKRELLLQEQNRYESENEKLRNNWIAPLNLGASWGYDKSYLGDYGFSKNTSASITQDIFRSGGIEYQIEYADAKKRADAMALNSQRAALNEEIFTSVLNYKKTLYQKEQSELTLKNQEIEIFIKQQLYDAGKADITELNNALVQQSSQLKNLVTYDYTLAKLKEDVAKISDINPAEFALPTLSLVKKENFLQENISLSYEKLHLESLKGLHGVTKSGYLPSLSVNADVGYREYESKKYTNREDGAYYGVGVALNIPLAYNAQATIQEAQATQMKQSAQVADKQRALNASYEQSIALIESYRRYNEVSTKNLSLYDGLISAIKAGVDAGTKTGYDLQIIKNTRAIEELNIKISEIDMQLELAKLHFSQRVADGR